METQTFTFHAKFGDAMKGLPRDAADELAAALVRFGCFGEEPDFENPYLAALFNMAREDIGYSIKKRSNGAKGGRPRNHAAEEVSDVVSETEKPESEEVSDVVSENEKPKQTNIANSTNNTNKGKGGARMARPTLAEVQGYIAEKGYHVDAEAFLAYYDSVGWRIGNKPMKSWRSALTTWERRDNPGGRAVQDADFSRFG